MCFIIYDLFSFSIETDTTFSMNVSQSTDLVEQHNPTNTTIIRDEYKTKTESDCDKIDNDSEMVASMMQQQPPLKFNDGK